MVIRLKSNHNKDRPQIIGDRLFQKVHRHLNNISGFHAAFATVTEKLF